MKFEQIKVDCRKYLGYIPCKPHKEYGVHCIDNQGKVCQYYEPADINILIIKLGAAGDVIRTTPLLSAFREKYKNAHITWLTQFPELVPSTEDHTDGADKILGWNETSILILKNSKYDIVINLDKDEQACALLKSINSKCEAYGYTLQNNKPYPLNGMAQHKYMTGLFDDISISNKKSYLEEVFGICGFEYKKQEYILPKFIKWNNSNIDKTKKVIGLNTGCGGRWTSRLWSNDYWIELINKLQTDGYEVIILGGPEEDEKNKEFSKLTGAKYFGIFPLKKFIGLMNECDVIVSGVTMATHIAIGLKKNLILMNNIFNRYEFELFGRGEIIEPLKECKCYFKPTCTNEEYKCMDYIYPEDVFKLVRKYVSMKD